MTARGANHSGTGDSGGGNNCCCHSYRNGNIQHRSQSANSSSRSGLEELEETPQVKMPEQQEQTAQLEVVREASGFPSGTTSGSGRAGTCFSGGSGGGGMTVLLDKDRVQHREEQTEEQVAMEEVTKFLEEVPEIRVGTGMDFGSTSVAYAGSGRYGRCS
jgi:hypothetical protein